MKRILSQNTEILSDHKVWHFGIYFHTINLIHSVKKEEEVRMSYNIVTSSTCIQHMTESRDAMR